ncbi:MAG: MFS transporter [Candidatus Bathyarchaeia archaeon]
MGLLERLRNEFSFFTGNYRILLISWMIMDLAMEMPVPNYQYFVQDVLGGNTFPLTLGIIGLANFVAMAAVAFPGGYLADKYGRRWLITTMTFGMAASYLFFALAPSQPIIFHVGSIPVYIYGWHFVLIGTVVHSLCLIYQPALFAMVQDSLPPEKRGMGSSLIQMIHGTFNTPGPVIAGFLLWAFGLEYSMRIIYLTMTVLFLIAAVWRLQLKETIKNSAPMRFRYFISSYPKAVKESFAVWRVVPRSVFWLTIVQIMMLFSSALFGVKNSIYARDQLEIPESQWWLVFIPLLLSMIVFSMPIGKMVDTMGPKKPLMLGPIALGLSMLIFTNSYGNLPSLMLAMCLQGIAHLLIMSSIMSLTASLVEIQNRGKVRGFVNFVGYISTGVGMLLGNLLYNLMPQLPYYLTALLALPMALLILTRVHEPQKTDPRY